MATDSTTTGTPTTPVDEFAERLIALGRFDSSRADLARLRRCAGRALSESPEAFPLFYRLLPYPVRGNDREEERYFLVATLFALNPKSSSARDFGATMAVAAGSRGAGRQGVDRRMAVILDSPFEDLTFRLRQAVALAASADVGVNWRALLSDLLWWDHPERRVQRRWARSYFGGGSLMPAEETPSTATTQGKE